jgi:C4-dicarboxylate-specific signal transduction histidine kinase
VSIGPLLQEVLSLLDYDLRHNDIRTTVDVPADLPLVVADRISIQQVLVNLIRNAIEAMSATGVPRTLEIRGVHAGEYVRVSITDNGGGVQPGIAERLFHPFNTTKASGMGLGLSICQSLVEAHGGHVGAGPHPSGGAQFYFELPVAA